MEYTSGAMVDREQSVNATCCSEDELGATEHEEEEDSLEETGAIATNPRQDGKQRQQQQQQDLERSRQDDMHARSQCAVRVVECDSCRQPVVAATLLTVHAGVCPQRELQCILNCGSAIQARHMYNHLGDVNFLEQHMAALLNQNLTLERQNRELRQKLATLHHAFLSMPTSRELSSAVSREVDSRLAQLKTPTAASQQLCEAVAREVDSRLSKLSYGSPSAQQLSEAMAKEASSRPQQLGAPPASSPPQLSNAEAQQAVPGSQQLSETDLRASFSRGTDGAPSELHSLRQQVGELAGKLASLTDLVASRPGQAAAMAEQAGGAGGELSSSAQVWHHFHGWAARPRADGSLDAMGQSFAYVSQAVQALEAQHPPRPPAMLEAQHPPRPPAMLTRYRDHNDHCQEHGRDSSLRLSGRAGRAGRSVPASPLRQTEDSQSAQKEPFSSSLSSIGFAASDGQQYASNPSVVTRANRQSRGSIGSCVTVLADENRVRQLANRSGGWNTGMSRTIGRSGEVLKVASDGTVSVFFRDLDVKFVYHPEALVGFYRPCDFSEKQAQKEERDRQVQSTWPRQETAEKLQDAGGCEEEASSSSSEASGDASSSSSEASGEASSSSSEASGEANSSSSSEESGDASEEPPARTGPVLPLLSALVTQTEHALRNRVDSSGALLRQFLDKQRAVLRLVDQSCSQKLDAWRGEQGNPRLASLTTVPANKSWEYVSHGGQGA